MAMNPWGGFYQRQSLAWWRERLDRCSYQSVWIMERTGERGMAWTFLPDGTAHDGAGHHMGTGFAWEIKQRGITADAYLGETYATGSASGRSARSRTGRC
jgi:hypothetical protein